MTHIEAIEVWYTPQSGGNWVVQEKDPEENQIGNAHYCYHKRDAKRYAEMRRLDIAHDQGNAPRLLIGTRQSG